MEKFIITILGPTAVGKTRIAARLANIFKGEIISADSRQVYRFMDIGTGKDLDDYVVNGQKVNYHLIDIVDPSAEFNLFAFQEEFGKAYDKITAKNKIPFLVGGTGMYLSSIIQNYNLSRVNFDSERRSELIGKDIDELKHLLLSLKPKQHNISDLTEKDRIIKAILIAERSKDEQNGSYIKSFNIGIKLDRSEIKSRITSRLKKRLDEGLLEEVQNLVAMGISFEKLKFFGLEYKYAAMHLNGELNYNDMYQKLNSAIHNFAKRQMTWFRKMEKERVIINWIEPQQSDIAIQLIEKYLKSL